MYVFLAMFTASYLEVKHASLLIINNLGHEMDVRSLTFPDSSFDIAIDKGKIPS